jgi:hypothetical protein
MGGANIYWTIIVGLISAGWAGTTFLRDRVSQSIERTSALVGRLMEVDKLTMENPEAQKYISQNAEQKEEWFRDKSLLGGDLFYKAKTLAYRQLNAFDELLSVSSRTSKRTSFMKPADVIELPAWERYIMVKLRHPLYRSILIHEEEIFGESLRRFWHKHKKKIELAPADPFIW